MTHGTAPGTGRGKGGETMVDEMRSYAERHLAAHRSLCAAMGHLEAAREHERELEWEDAIQEILQEAGHVAERVLSYGMDPKR